jgi:hypothetical protein
MLDSPLKIYFLATCFLTPPQADARKMEGYVARYVSRARIKKANSVLSTFVSACSPESLIWPTKWSKDLLATWKTRDLTKQGHDKAVKNVMPHLINLLKRFLVSVH